MDVETVQIESANEEEFENSLPHIILTIPDGTDRVDGFRNRDNTIDGGVYVKNLVEVHFPVSLESIERGSFMGCGDLTTLHFAHNRTPRIANSAFQDCEKITVVHASSTQIGTFSELIRSLRFMYCDATVRDAGGNEFTLTVELDFEELYNGGRYSDLLSQLKEQIVGKIEEDDEITFFGDLVEGDFDLIDDTGNVVTAESILARETRVGFSYGGGVDFNNLLIYLTNESDDDEVENVLEPLQS